MTGSRVRAAVLEELFGEAARPRSVSSLARIAGARHFAVQKELARLRAAGVIRERPLERKAGPLYEADPRSPGHLELCRYFRVTGGTPARIREAIALLDPVQLAWVYGPYAEGTPGPAPICVVSISREPRRVREAIRGVECPPGRPLVVDAVSIAEWTYRLERRELRVLAIRRAPRLWLIGDPTELRRRERSEIASRKSRQDAIRNWREELSDDWDENFDPYAPAWGERAPR